MNFKSRCVVRIIPRGIDHEIVFSIVDEWSVGLSLEAQQAISKHDLRNLTERIAHRLFSHRIGKEKMTEIGTALQAMIEEKIGDI